MEPTTVTATFYVAADHHDGHMRVIATEQDRTFVYDELEQMLKSISYDLYCDCEDMFDKGDYEHDHRKFRLTMSIEEVTE